MRVIAGLAKGRRLFTPKSKEIRPVLDQVKEAIFNILFDVEGLRVLDLFAGTGAMGLEALSRGAAEAVFVDSSKEALHLIDKNLDTCGFADRASVLQMTAARAVKILSGRGQPFDLIFVDPPYQKNLVRKTLKQLSQSSLLHERTIIIVEHHPKEPIGNIVAVGGVGEERQDAPPDFSKRGFTPRERIDGLTLTDERKYGQTLVSFLKLK